MCEFWFGQLKRSVGHQLPSIKTYILAAERMQWSQRAQGLQLPKLAAWSGRHLTVDQIHKTACQAKKAACTLRALATVGDSPERVEESLDAWYEDDGRAHFLGTDLMEHATDAPEDPHSDEAFESEDEEVAQLEVNQERRVEHEFSCWRKRLPSSSRPRRT